MFDNEVKFSRLSHLQQHDRSWIRAMVIPFSTTIAKICLIVILTAIGSGAYAAELSPVGLWQTIDDNSGKPRGLVRITETNGEYQGRVEKTFPKPGEDQNPKCEKCDGARRDQPVIGMTILWGLKKQGDEYNGGEILDPENGKVYRARMRLDDGGKTLDVRGFIGFSIFGRSQTWIRQE
jgi:uncharacterized protein (DUF2147 family)